MKKAFVVLVALGVVIGMSSALWADDDDVRALAQDVTTNEDTAVAITLTATNEDSEDDQDDEDDSLIFEVSSAPVHGVLSGTPPNLVYTPGADYNGLDSFIFKVCEKDDEDDDDASSAQFKDRNEDEDDDHLSALSRNIERDDDEDGDTEDNDDEDSDTENNDDEDGDNEDDDDCSSATVTIIINPVNDAPTAVDDVVTTDEDTAIAVITVLANDTDPDGDTVAIDDFTQPTHGTAGSNGDGTLTYTPDINYNGPDSFTYTITDGNLGLATANVTVTVNAVNDPPIADAGPDQAALQGGNVTLDGSGSSDIDGDSITYNWMFISVPTGSTAGLSDPSIVNPTFTADVAGTYEVQLIVNDGKIDSAPATATVNVIKQNRPPVITPIDDQVMDENTTLNLPLSATDPDGDLLTFTTLGLPSFARLVDNGNGTGTIIFTPGYNDASVYTIYVSVSDGTLEDVDSFILTVNDVNRPPTADAGGPYSTPAETAILQDGSGSSDPDNDPLTYTWDFGDGTPIGNGIQINHAYAAEGTYQVSLTVNDGRGGSNTATTQTVVGAANVIDIEPIHIDMSSAVTNPQTLAITGSIVVDIQNNGSMNISDSYRVTLFEDTNFNRVYDPLDDNIMGSTIVSSGHAAGTSVPVTVNVNASILFKGTLVFAFADSENKIVETDESNNIIHNMTNCEYIPPVGQFNPVVEWEWGYTQTPSEYSNFRDIWSTPIVVRVHDKNNDGQLDQDDPPNVIFVSGNSLRSYCSGNGTCRTGKLRVLDGLTGEEVWSLDTPVSGSNLGFAGLSVAVGDIDQDNKPDIVAMSGSGYIIIVNGDGEIIRISDLPVGAATNASFGWGGGISIGDMDADGFPEIAYGRTLFETNNGEIKRLWVGSRGSGGGPNKALSYFADLDADGQLELVAGFTAYRKDGSILWDHNLAEGYSGVADLNLDTKPEVAYVSQGRLYIWDGATGNTILGPVTIPGTGSGGPPTIADFDGDGVPEIGVAKSNYYSVMKPNFINNRIDVLWSQTNHDMSSSVTGSSVFDFDGDGKVEVVYNDECYLWIYDGIDGSILHTEFTQSFTATEAAIVADVDGDGNAEMLLIANGANPNKWTCAHHNSPGRIVSPHTKPFPVWQPPAGVLDYRGLRVIGDVNDTWVNARDIWNQHAYSITNVNDDGTIPLNPEPNWKTHNTFRCNISKDALACVDLTSSYIRVDNSNFPNSINIYTRIGNSGALHVLSGVYISFYDGDPEAGGILIGTNRSENRLDPGTYENVSLQWNNPAIGTHTIFIRVDDDGTGRGRISEIDETNNMSSAAFNTGNHYPFADAGPDQLLYVNETAELDGTGSSDPDGDSITYNWRITAKPQGSNATLSDITSPAPTFLLDLTGTYRVRLLVNDGIADSGISTITITSSPVIHVPYVVGMPRTDAESTIVSASLLTGNIATQYSDTVAAGLVISQSPLADTVVTINTPVDIVISLGIRMVTVPDIINMLQADAETAITNVLLVTGIITEEYIGGTPLGHVFQQSPAPGTLVPYNTPVDFTVSLGPWTGPDNTPPNVTISASPDPVNTGNTVTITVTATDNVGVVSRNLTVNGTSVPLAGNQGTYTADTPGMITAQFTATDAAGLTGTATTTFGVIDPNDTTPPVVTLDEQDCIDVTDLYPVFGSISDAGGFNYQLLYRMQGTDVWKSFYSGEGSNIKGELGVFDPTIIKNGVYEILVYAQDLTGNTAYVVGCVLVDGGLKVGQVNFAADDMELPQPGFPLNVTREYDNRDQDSGDFGPGWNLPSSNVKPNVTKSLGNGWDQQAGGGMFTTYYLIELHRHVVVIRFSDDEVIKFALDVNPKSSILYPFNEHKPLSASYLPIGKTRGTLQALDVSSHVMMIGNQLRQWGVDLYEPTKFRYTRPDGTSYVISKVNGIESMTDVYGHTITYSNTGIQHSSGAGVTFERGAGNRIQKITDTWGREITYYYDANGCLEKISQSYYANPTFNKYAYDQSNRLEEIKAPDGTTLGKFEYDASGRLTALEDPDRNRIIYGYDIPNHKQEITDKLGNVTLYEFDGKGNVTLKTDPLGNKTEWTYDSNGNHLTEVLTDDTGTIITDKAFEYDANNNKIFEHVDLIGENRVLTTGYTYNIKNEILGITDPEQNTTSYAYDSQGNLTRFEEPEGKVTTNTYDADGNVLTTQVCNNSPTVFEYDSRGLVTKETDPLGNVTDFTYYTGGNVETETRTRTTEDINGNPLIVTMVTRYEYGYRDKLTRTIDPYGEEEITEYNVLGKESAFVDKNGSRKEYEYDTNNNLEYVRYVDDNTFEHYTYDPAGNKLSYTDRDGRITGFAYDAMSRLTDTYYCGLAGSCTSANAIHASSLEYDASGQVKAKTDENNVRTEYDYDEAGRQIIIRQFHGAQVLETVNTYDDNGNLKTTTDANLHTTTYEYDGQNRRARTIFHDQSYTEVQYDCAGNREYEYVQALPGQTDRIKTRFEYDALGRLLKVINDHQGSNETETDYTYDEVGNKITQTDPNNHTTRWVYNHLGRVVKHTLPEGMYETFTYYPDGNVETKTDFNGDTTTYRYSPCCGHLISKLYDDGTGVTYTYTPSGQVDTITDVRGTIDHDYDDRGRLSQVQNPDGTLINYTYYPNGDRHTVTTPSGTTTYTYDDLNRLVTVTDPNNGVTTYAYDNAGNRAGIIYPNGSVTAYTYDSLNRLTDILNSKSGGDVISSYTYTLGPAGNRVNVVENSGRNVEYQYDRLQRLTQEIITDPVLGNDAISYTYNNFGNRLTKTDSAGTISYTYDINGRLLTETAPGSTYTYAYDNNGNTLAKSDGTDTTVYAYDYENRLVTVDNGTNIIDYAYDADGIRVESSVDAVVTKFVVDKNRDYAQVIEETDGTGALIVYYTYGDDLISQNRSNIESFYIYDGQMSARQLTDINEDVTDSYTFDAFGITLDHAGATVNNYLYTGEQFDPNVGFYYLRARYYDQAVGRFVTTDPWEGILFEPDTLNKYLYVNADPINYIDPSGYFGFTLGELNAAQAIQKILRRSNTAQKLKTLNKARFQMCRVLRGALWHGHHLVPLVYGGLGSHTTTRTKDKASGLIIPRARKAHTALHSIINRVLSIKKLIPKAGRSKDAFTDSFDSGEINDVDVMQVLLDVAIFADFSCKTVKGYKPLRKKLMKSLKKHGYKVKGVIISR